MAPKGTGTETGTKGHALCHTDSYWEQGKSDRNRWTGTEVPGQNDRDGIRDKRGQGQANKNKDINKRTEIIKGQEQGQNDTNRDWDRDLQKKEMDMERSRRTGTVTD